MNATIRPEFEQVLQDKVRSGRFASIDDAVNGAIEALQVQESLLDADPESLRRELMAGVEQLRRGDGKPWDVNAAKARLQAHLAR
jgi:antitoxin ParD1/3/4